MPTVFVPAILRSLISVPRVAVSGSSVGEIIGELEARFPGVAAMLVSEDDMAPGIAVAINDQVGQMGLMEPVPPDAEVHFLPAISGG
jgi:molybdopterin converting factor small subunit